MKCACRRVCRVHLCIQNGRSMSVAYLLPCVSLLNEDGHTKKKKKAENIIFDAYSTFRVLLAQFIMRSTLAAAILLTTSFTRL